MLQEINLGELPLAQTAVVKQIIDNSTLMKRIISLGVTEGAEITSIFQSPFGDPTAYFVKGCVIALRKSDCKGIIVSPKGDAHEAG